MSTLANRPLRHHYIPEFYSKRWAIGSTLIEWSRPREIIKPKSVSPKATGFQHHLYALRGFEPEVAQQVEEVFFKPTDNDAATAMAILEADEGGTDLKPRLRDGWTRFLLSLLMRTPEDMVIFREYWPQIFRAGLPESEERYAAIRQEGDPLTFAEHLASLPPSEDEKSIFTTLIAMIDNKEAGTAINAMNWDVLDLSGSGYRLLTSDRPIVQTNGIRPPSGHFAIALGPTKLFLATSSKQVRIDLMAMTANDLARNYNRQVVEGAERYVYSDDERQKRFIENRFGTVPRERLLLTSMRKYRDNLLGRKPR